jgi:hypothetical protein
MERRRTRGISHLTASAIAPLFEQPGARTGETGREGHFATTAYVRESRHTRAARDPGDPAEARLPPHSTA